VLLSLVWASGLCLVVLSAVLTPDKGEHRIVFGKKGKSQGNRGFLTLGTGVSFPPHSRAVMRDITAAVEFVANSLSEKALEARE